MCRIILCFTLEWCCRGRGRGRRVHLEEDRADALTGHSDAASRAHRTGHRIRPHSGHHSDFFGSGSRYCNAATKSWDTRTQFALLLRLFLSDSDSDPAQIHASVPTTISLAETPSSSDEPASDTSGSTLAPVHPSIDLTYLFGNAPSPDQQTLYSSYVAQIATLVWTSECDGQIGTSHNPVVVGIALKPPRSSEKPSDTDRATFLQVMDLVREALNTARTTCT